MRERDVHIWEGRALILTTAHEQKDLDHVIDAFEQGIAELQRVNLLPTKSVATHDNASALNEYKAMAPDNQGAHHTAPVPGAKLGRTREGYPAWFVSDPESPGDFIQVGEHLTASDR